MQDRQPMKNGLPSSFLSSLWLFWNKPWKGKCLSLNKNPPEVLTLEEVLSCLCDPVKAVSGEDSASSLLLTPNLTDFALCRKCRTPVWVIYFITLQKKHSPNYTGEKLPEKRQGECCSPHHGKARTTVSSFTVSKWTSRQRLPLTVGCQKNQLMRENICCKYMKRELGNY